MPLRDELSRKEDRLREVEDLSRSRDLFLAALSHELRTPLSGIVGAARLLNQTELDARQHEYTRLIAHAGSTVLEIVDDMLTFARVQAGKAETAYTTFSVHQLIDGMLALQGINARQRGLTLVSDVSADVPVVLTGERGKLNQILLNVIGNAIKFTDQGTIRVQVACQGSQEDEVWLHFTVQDTGIGIDSADSDRLFMPFCQGDEQGAERGGTGLGLAICRRLIQSMGGEINIEGVPGEGTTVSFSIPFQLPDRLTQSQFIQTGFSHEQPEKSDVDAAQVLTSTRGQLVLVIEDDEINRVVCMRILALLGFHPMVAADSAQALQIAREGRHQPDVIIIDVNLAGESGADLATQLQTVHHGRWKNIPIIAMSADVSGAAQRSAKQAGISQFIKKPFSMDQLDNVIQAVLEHNSDAETASTRPVPYVHTVRADPELRARADLNESWLAQELEDLGFDTMLEMLNIFRASAATTLRALAQAIAQRDASQAGSLAHKLAGSALNLGMRGVARQADEIQSVLSQSGDKEWIRLKPVLDALEACCHLSADLVRAYLVEHAEKRITFTARGDQ